MAKQQLSLRYLHMKTSKTGVLDLVFDRYLQRAAPRGISFLDWIQSDDYDAPALTREFHAGGLGSLLTDTILRRE